MLLILYELRISHHITLYLGCVQSVLLNRLSLSAISMVHVDTAWQR